VELVLLLRNHLVKVLYIWFKGQKESLVQYAKRMLNKPNHGGSVSNLPFKIECCRCNAYNLCSAIMFIPITLVGAFSDCEEFIRVCRLL